MVLLVVLIATWSVREVWAPSQLHSASLGGGFFEEPPEDPTGVSITVDRSLARTMLPDVAAMDDESLSVPYGHIIANIGEGDFDYTVSTADEGRLPLVIVGRMTTEPNDDDDIPDTIRLRDLESLTANPGGVAFVPFTSRPWRDDVARLASLASACPDAESMHVQRRDGQLQITLGSCELVHPRAGTTVAFAAGPRWLKLTSPQRQWEDERVAKPTVAVVTLVLCLLVTLLLASWLGAGPTLLMAALGGALSPLQPWLGVVWWMGGALIGAGHSVWRGARTLGRARSAAIVAGLVVVVAILVALSNDEAPDPPTGEFCLVTGYSTVDGEGMHSQHRRPLSEELGSVPGPCHGVTSGHGFRSKTLWRIRRFACGQSPDTLLLFFGGNNDDILWTQSPDNWATMALVWLRFGVSGQPRENNWDDLFSRTISTGEAGLPQQEALIHEIATCRGRDPATFVFVHHFLLFDLEGLPQRRQTMREARGQAVRDAGGIYVDAFEQLGAEASVTWFSDFVHLSSIGHARMGRLLAAHVPTPKP
ncbi:MAG: SGNH/GDSL hydrolase family protein [Myxococcota bacterium]